MNREDTVKTLVSKHGAIEVSRNYIRGIRSALTNIRIGIETNNFALASKDVGLLAEHLSNLETVYKIGKESLDQIQRLERDEK